MSEMIERAKNALAAEIRRQRGPGQWRDPEFEPDLAGCVRAVIEEMREPTAKMVEAAYWSALGENAIGVWEDMIDTALKTD